MCGVCVLVPHVLSGIVYLHMESTFFVSIWVWMSNNQGLYVIITWAEGRGGTQDHSPGISGSACRSAGPELGSKAYDEITMNMLS